MSDHAHRDRPERQASAPPVEDGAPQLLTFRIIGLLDSLRRSGALANRREFGLTGIEWRIMAQVGEHAPLSLNALVERLGLDPGQLSRATKALVTRGLLDRRRKPGSPAIMITLSGDGRTLHARMMDLARQRNAFLVNGVAAEDVVVATNVLDTVLRNAQLLLDRERAESDAVDDR